MIADMQSVVDVSMAMQRFTHSKNICNVCINLSQKYTRNICVSTMNLCIFQNTQDLRMKYLTNEKRPEIIVISAGAESDSQKTKEKQIFTNKTDRQTDYQEKWPQRNDNRNAENLILIFNFEINAA